MSASVSAHACAPRARPGRVEEDAQRDMKNSNDEFSQVYVESMRNCVKCSTTSLRLANDDAQSTDPTMNRRMRREPSVADELQLCDGSMRSSTRLLFSVLLGAKVLLLNIGFSSGGGLRPALGRAARLSPAPIATALRQWKGEHTKHSGHTSTVYYYVLLLNVVLLNVVVRRRRVIDSWWCSPHLHSLCIPAMVSIPKCRWAPPDMLQLMALEVEPRDGP